jgi:hypothetical protein
MLSPSPSKITDLAIPGASLRPSDRAAPLKLRNTSANLWVPRTGSRHATVLIFVEEATKAVVSLNLGDLGWRAVGEWS